MKDTHRLGFGITSFRSKAASTVPNWQAGLQALRSEADWDAVSLQIR